MVISFHACRLCLLYLYLHFSVLMCYHDNMITYKTDFVNPHSYFGEISAFVTKSFLYRINYLILANYSKVQFYKNSTNSLTLSHLGHSNGFASCKARCVLISASLPKTPFPRKGAILLGLPPLDPVWGYAPKQGCFGCLPKVLHDAKPTEQATLNTHF